jgi:hypothetical protein
MLGPASRRSEIVIRSDSERKAEIAAGIRRELGAIFLTSPDFRTTV